MPDTHSAQVCITNRLGLHARPAMAFVDTANGFESSVRLRKGDEDVDGRAIMEIMMLAATQGTELEIVTSGVDAADCLSALKDLVERGFDEH